MGIPTAILDPKRTLGRTGSNARPMPPIRSLPSLSQSAQEGGERSLTEWARSLLASYRSAGAFWSSAICLSETGRTSCR